MSTAQHPYAQHPAVVLPPLPQAPPIVAPPLIKRRTCYWCKKPVAEDAWADGKSKILLMMVAGIFFMLLIPVIINSAGRFSRNYKPTPASISLPAQSVEGAKRDMDANRALRAEVKRVSNKRIKVDEH